MGMIESDTQSNIDVSKKHPSSKDWFPVISLAIAAFIFNTTEFAPIALLSDIAKDLKVSDANAGLLITVYAWVVAIASLPLILICGRIERRKLLSSLFILFIGSHILSYFSSSYAVLMTSRIGIALAHSVFWSITTPLAVRLAPAGHKATALSIIATGSSLAAILGLPIGRTIGIYLGWRITFLTIAVVATIVLIILIRLLPRIEGNDSGTLRSLPSILKNKALMGIYLLTVVVITAHFTGYSYIEPFLNTVVGLDSNVATLVLLLFGLAGIMGSLIFSKYSGKYPIGLMITAVVCTFISLILLYPMAFNEYSMVLLCAFWGIATMIFSLVLQTKVIQLAPNATAVAMSIYSGIYNVGIGGGALVGGIVSERLSMEYIGYVGSAIALVGLIFCILYLKPQLNKNSTNF